MQLAYKNIRECCTDQGFESCEFCPDWQKRECFDYHFYWANFEESQLLDED